MTATTLNGVLLTGTAAARPAASAVAKGTLYSATDTGTISQSDGSTWSTWAFAVGGAGFTNPMTTAGDIIYSSSGSTAARLAASSTNRILTSAGFSTAPYWGQGALASTGDIMLGNNNGTPTRLAAGASTFVLTSLGTNVNPAWQAPTGGGGGGGNWTLITDTTLGSDTASFDFTSIAGTYKHLVIVLSARSDRAGQTSDFVGMRFNNDSAGNYDYQWGQFYTTTSFAEGQAQTSIADIALIPAASSSANAFGGVTIWIPDYANTTNFKWAHAEGFCKLTTGSGNTRSILSSGDWLSTAAITRVTLILTGGGSNFKTNSRATLYGVS